MFQEINLYEPIFREEEKLFSATAIGKGLAIVVVGLAGIALLFWWRVNALDHQLQAIKTQDAEHRRFVTDVNSMLDQGESKETIEARIKALAVELDRRQQALNYLHADAAGPVAGFAERMEALARQQVDGLWLRGAVFTAESGRLSLTGSATNPELVPIYLSRLATEKVLAGTRLDQVDIHQAKVPGRGAIDFDVSTGKTDGAKPAGVAAGTTPAIAANTGVRP